MSVANRAVDAVMGPRQTEAVHGHEGAPTVAPAAKCQLQQDQPTQCIQGSYAPQCTRCQYLDALKACQQERTQAGAEAREENETRE
eukprot:8994540-Lingulodinium_polyedra.AAC.1